MTVAKNWAHLPLGPKRGVKTVIPSGAEYGRLRVLVEDGRIGGAVAYLCRCTCGKEKRFPASSIVKGNVRSCGCLKIETSSKNGRSRRAVILAGAQYGRLTVIGEGLPRRGRPTYRCKCTCGREKDATAADLTSGRVQSCKCLMLERSRQMGQGRKCIISSGTEYGRLKVVSEDGRLGIQTAYLCSCDCGIGNTKRVRAGDLISGTTRSCGCLKSQPELDLVKCIRDQLVGIEVVHNTRTVIFPAELDVWIPHYGLGIEFNGLYWHGESIAPERRLLSYQKYLACKALGIRLVTIFEDEWELKRPTIEGYLKAIFGQKKTVGARKCALEKADSSHFFDLHHLQGSVRGYHYRLTLNGEVVAAAAFSRATKSKAMGTQDVWELTRYAALPELSVAGGASKMLRAFLKDTPECQTVISYSDNRWSEGRMYEAMGFRLERESKPSFSYFRQRMRVHRFNWRKSEALRVYGGSPDETEWEIMQRNGWDRIWDCGKKRWTMEVSPRSL